MESLVQKYRRIPLALKAGMWFTICFIIQRGIQFVGMPVFTRLMTQDDYGQYSSFNSWAHILVIVTSLNIYAGVFNKAMIKYGESKDQYVSSIQFLTFLVSIIFAGIIYILRTLLSDPLNVDARCFLLLALYTVSFPVTQYWSQRQRFEYKYKSIISITLIESLLWLAVGILFVVSSKADKGFALINSTVYVQISISVVLSIFLMWKGKTLFNKEYWWWTLGLAIPLLPHYLSEVLLGHADRIMINAICGSDKAAVYNIAYQISMLMTVIRTGLNGAFLPWEYKRIKNGEYDTIRTTTNIYATAMAVMTIFFMLVGPEILTIAAPASYREAMYIIPAIMAACFFIFIYVLFSNVEIYYEKKQFVAIASITAAISNVLLNYVCINRWGYLTAGYTTAISYGIMVVMHFAFLKRIAKNHDEIKLFYNGRHLTFLISAVLLTAALSVFLYNYTMLRYSIVAGLLLSAFVYRRIIITFVKTIVVK